MSIKGYDFELNGVKYYAAESAQGDHYLLQGQPLRPPNAVSVQGENSQKFQMRPDTLLWALTDWSGGEGQRKYNAQAPNRHWQLNAVRAFDRQGSFRAGPHLEVTQDSTGASDFAIELVMVSTEAGLYGYDVASANRYLWDAVNEKWGVAAALTGPTAGAAGIASDGQYIFWREAGTSTIWRSTPGSATGTALCTTGLSTTKDEHLVAQGGYVYVVGSNTDTKQIMEISKTVSTPDAIDDFSISVSRASLVAVDGSVYAMASNGVDTEVRVITPTSAAGTGFGTQFALFVGFSALGMWTHSGTLYLSGQDKTSGEMAIMYVSVDGTYGTLGKIRDGTSDMTYLWPGEHGAPQNVRSLDHFLVSDDRDENGKPSLWQIDAITGGLANYAIAEDFAGTHAYSYNVVTHGRDFFFSGDTVPNVVFRAVDDQYHHNCSVVSPWHDFDLASEKILSSVFLSCEALPADWEIDIEYRRNNETAWTSIGTITTDNTTGEKFFVSTDSSSISFKTIQFRIVLDWVGAGVPTTTPVVLGLDVFALVAKPQRIWTLLLDCSDSKARKDGSSGAKKIANIETAGESESVVDFKDGYQSRDPDVHEQVDVVVDSYEILLSQPGEGVARVVLKELP